MTTAVRNTTRRDRIRRQLARGKPPCALCHQPIDYTANHLHPDSYTIDHIIPLSKGGNDTLDNCQPSCRACNRTKSDKVDSPEATTWSTWRSW